MAKGKVNDGLSKEGAGQGQPAESIAEKGQVKDIAFVGKTDEASMNFLAVLREKGIDFDVCCTDTMAGYEIMQKHGITTLPALKKMTGDVLDFAALTKTDNNEDTIV